MFIPTPERRGGERIGIERNKAVYVLDPETEPGTK